jgi:phenylalanine-4-hydroxylase
LGPEIADHWLGLVELFEIARANDGGELTTQAEQRLLEFIILYPNLKKLIDDGLRVAKEEDLNNH